MVSIEGNLSPCPKLHVLTIYSPFKFLMNNNILEYVTNVFGILYLCGSILLLTIEYYSLFKCSSKIKNLDPAEN